MRAKGRVWLNSHLTPAFASAFPLSFLALVPPRSHDPQVVHCRRILKWTYATAFYAFADPVNATKEAKARLAQHQEFFEFNQVGCWVPVVRGLVA